MRTYNLDIKEIENKIVITVDKNQLDADYILSLINWLQFATNNAVIAKPTKRIWNYSGSVDLNHQLDNVNLRDLAYE